MNVLEYFFPSGIEIETLIPLIPFNGFIVMVLTPLLYSFFVTCLAVTVGAVH